MATVARTRYQLSKFDSTKAKAYALVAMVKDTVEDTAILDNMDSNGNWNSDFVGAGVCKTVSGSSSLGFTVDGITYMFNASGEPASQSSVGYKLTMATILENISSSGNAATGTQHGSTTKGADGSIVDNGVTYEQKTIAIDNLNARDQFAIEALRSIISGLGEDATNLPDSTISHFCQQAYRYAAYMMTASANARGTFTDNTETSADAKAAAVGSLDNNTDKLINNLIVAIERTQSKTIIDGEEVYAQNIDFDNIHDVLEKIDSTNEVLVGIREDITSGLANLHDAMLEQLKAFNKIASNLEMINASIQGYNQQMTSKFNSVNDNVQSFKNDAMGLLNEVSTDTADIKQTTKTIDKNLTAIGKDVALIKEQTTPLDLDKYMPDEEENNG